MTYHHGRLRAAIIEAAVELVAERGPDNVSMREAARRAGVSSGAPFRHFTDKKALMTAVAGRGAESLMTQLAAVLSNHGGTPLEQLQALGVAYVGFAVRHPGYFRVMHKPEYALLDDAGPVRDALLGSRQLMRKLVEDAQRQGSLPEADPDQLMLGAHALVYGLARMFVDGLMAQQGVSDEQAETIARAVTGQWIIAEPQHHAGT